MLGLVRNVSYTPHASFSEESYTPDVTLVRSFPYTPDASFCEEAPFDSSCHF